MSNRNPTLAQPYDSEPTDIRDLGFNPMTPWVDPSDDSAETKPSDDRDPLIVLVMQLRERQTMLRATTAPGDRITREKLIHAVAKSVQALDNAWSVEYYNALAIGLCAGCGVLVDGGYADTASARCVGCYQAYTGDRDAKPGSSMWAFLLPPNVVGAPSLVYEDSPLELMRITPGPFPAGPGSDSAPSAPVAPLAQMIQALPDRNPVAWTNESQFGKMGKSAGGHPVFRGVGMWPTKPAGNDETTVDGDETTLDDGDDEMPPVKKRPMQFKPGMRLTWRFRAWYIRAIVAGDAWIRDDSIRDDSRNDYIAKLSELRDEAELL